MSETLCPACEVGHLHHDTGSFEESYKGKVGIIPISLSRCDFCGSEISSDEDLRNARRALIQFKKQVDGLLSGDEVRAFRKRFGLTQSLANKLFGGGAVAFSRYESDELMQSEQMDQLLRLCIEEPTNLRRVASRKGIALPAPKICAIYGSKGAVLSPHGVHIATLHGQATHQQSWENVDFKLLGVASLFNSGTARSKADISVKFLSQKQLEVRTIQ